MTRKTETANKGPVCDCPCVTTPWPTPLVDHLAGCAYEGVEMTDMERLQGVVPVQRAWSESE